MPIVSKNVDGICFNFSHYQHGSQVSALSPAASGEEKNSGTALETSVERDSGAVIVEVNSSSELHFSYDVFGGAPQYQALGSFEATMQQQPKDLIEHVRGVLGAYVKQMTVDLKTHEQSYISNGMNLNISYKKLTLVYDILGYMRQHSEELETKLGIDAFALFMHEQKTTSLPAVYKDQPLSHSIASTALSVGSWLKNSVWSSPQSQASSRRLERLMEQVIRLLDYSKQKVAVHFNDAGVSFGPVFIFNPIDDNYHIKLALLSLDNIRDLPAGLDALRATISSDNALSASVKDGFAQYVDEYNKLVSQLNQSGVASYEQIQRLYLLVNSINSMNEKYNQSPMNTKTQKRHRKKRKQPSAKISYGFFSGMRMELWKKGTYLPGTVLLADESKQPAAVI